MRWLYFAGLLSAAPALAQHGEAAVAAAGEEYGMRVMFPPSDAPGATVAGTVSGVSFDEALRDAVRGAMRVLR